MGGVRLQSRVCGILPVPWVAGCPGGSLWQLPPHTQVLALGASDWTPLSWTCFQYPFILPLTRVCSHLEMLHWGIGCGAKCSQELTKEPGTGLLTPSPSSEKSILQVSGFQVPVLLAPSLEWLESSHYSRRKAAPVGLKSKLGLGLGSPCFPHGLCKDLRTSPRTDHVHKCLITLLSLSQW